MGKYQGIDDDIKLDSGVCFFLIVSDERIDGVYGITGSYRWDFRRKLK